jgi:hypothetical protein
MSKNTNTASATANDDFRSDEGNPILGTVGDDLSARAQEQEAARTAAQANAIREYKPANSLFRDEEQRQKARALGKAIFMLYINDLEAATRESPSEIVKHLDRTPFQYPLALASKVVRGMYFIDEIDFEQVARKGGTLNEWLLQGLKHLARCGYEPAKALLA